MQIIEQNEDGFCILEVIGRLDTVSASEFDQMVAVLMERHNADMILDLSKLDYISSIGLRSILAVTKKLRAGGRKLALCGLTDFVKEVFEVSGFDSVIPVFESVAAAKSQVK